MNATTSAIATRPAKMLAWRNAAPSVGSTVVLASSLMGNGSEPNSRTVTRFWASRSG